MTPSLPYGDLRSIQAGLQASLNGINPQMANPSDLWHRAMNYPAVWLKIASMLSLQTESNLMLFGAFTALIFTCACAFLMLRWPTWLLMIGALSPAVLLALERGNNDLICFALMVLFCALGQWWSVLPFGAAVLLKIYPLIALHAVAVHSSFRRTLVFGGVAALILCYLAPELPLILSGNTAAGPNSFGVRNIYVWTARILVKAGFGRLESACLVTFALLSILVVTFKLRPRACGDDKVASRDYCLVGAAIYVYSYVLTVNWDYRLMFLLMCIPYLARPELRWYGRVTCLAILTALFGVWLSEVSQAGVVVGQLAKAAVVALLIPVLMQPFIELVRKTRDGATVPVASDGAIG
jgi:hypothetical protein